MIDHPTTDMTDDTDTDDSTDGGSHIERLTDTEHEVRWLGELDGLAVAENDGTPVLFLHGDKRSAAVEVRREGFVDGLARAGVEIEEVSGDE